MRTACVLRMLPLVLVLSFPGYGGAWLQGKNDGQSITEFSYSAAKHNFGRTRYVRFRKLYMQNYSEQELTPYLTLFTAPEYMIGRYETASYLRSGRDYAMTAGLRVGENTSWGAYSLQLSYKYGQTFSMTVSDDVSATQEVEIRPQYGRNFEICGHGGFIDVEGIWRWAMLPRPNEAGFDVTLGLYLLPGTQLLGQNFSVFSAGYGDNSYPRYSLHKAKLSLVQHLWHSWRVQLGVLYAYSGYNVVAERGVSLSLWVRF